MRDIRILPVSDAEQFTAAIFDIFKKSVEAQRAAIHEQDFDTCTVCHHTYRMGDEFNSHCCGTRDCSCPTCTAANEPAYTSQMAHNEMLRGGY
jgi:hypothetical protein